MRVGVLVSLKTIPQVCQIEVPAVFPAKGRAFCGGSGPTPLVCCSSVVLYIPLTGDNCEQTTDSPRHGSGSFGFELSTSLYGLYTSTSSPGINTGYGLTLTLFTACLSARSVRFRRASFKAICKLSRVVCANSSISDVFSYMRNPDIHIDWKPRLSPERLEKASHTSWH